MWQSVIRVQTSWKNYLLDLFLFLVLGRWDYEGRYRPIINDNCRQRAPCSTRETRPDVSLGAAVIEGKNPLFPHCGLASACPGCAKNSDLSDVFIDPTLFTVSSCVW